MRAKPVIDLEHVPNPDPEEGQRARMAALKLLVEIILDNDARYGLPEGVDPEKVA